MLLSNNFLKVCFPDLTVEYVTEQTKCFWDIFVAFVMRKLNVSIGTLDNIKNLPLGESFTNSMFNHKHTNTISLKNGYESFQYTNGVFLR